MVLYVGCTSSKECGSDEICVNKECVCVGAYCPGIMIGFEILIKNNRLCCIVKFLNILFFKL